MTKPSATPQEKGKAYRELWLWQEQCSNRALVREVGEKHDDDVNGEPSEHWRHYIEYAALEDAKAEIANLNRGVTRENDDWMKLRTENFEKFQEIRSLQDRLAVAVEALEQYGSCEYFSAAINGVTKERLHSDRCRKCEALTKLRDAENNGSNIR